LNANKLKVYWSVTPEQSNSPYIIGIANGLRANGWEVRKLSLLSLAVSRNQIIHVQWPEHVSRGSGFVRTAAKQVRAMGILITAALAKHKIVITAHNREPHGKSGRFDRWFRKQVYRRAKALVALVSGHAVELSEAKSIAPNAIIKTIPHPLTQLGNVKGSWSDEGALVILGQIHPYHLIEEFLEALEAVNNKRSVVIVGKVGDPDLLQRLSFWSNSCAWINLIPGFVSDKELEEVLTGSAAVVSLALCCAPIRAAGCAVPRCASRAAYK